MLFRSLSEPAAYTLATQHNHFFTFGENFGLPECSIPDDGFQWRATRQPVVLDLWPQSPGNSSQPWTTVMQWDSYRVREWNQIQYGMKSASFEPYLDLPQQSVEHFELALGSASAPREQLSALGWQLLDPLSVSRSPGDYQSFIAQSKGEWSIAKQGYVASCSGWFSERSAAYLASGRPVVLQDTGFSRFLEVGQGLLAFTTPREALTALAEVHAAYARHTEAAREIAIDYFDAAKVLRHLLERIFSAAPL